MSSKKEHESMENLDRCYKIVQQSSAKGGISAIQISEKTGIHRATIHRHLTSLALMGKVESQQGLWVTRTGEQTIKPLEKEIVIKLPLPKSDVQRVALLESTSRIFQDPNNTVRILLDKLEETRTIRITGKNVDELDLLKISELVKQATERSYKAKLKSLFIKPKKSENSVEKASNKEPVRE